MSDCLVLKTNKNGLAIFMYLKYIEKKINFIAFQGTGLKHLDQQWLFKQEVIIPKLYSATLYNLFDSINKKIQKEENKMDDTKSLKTFMLSNLFI